MHLGQWEGIDGICQSVGGSARTLARLLPDKVMAVAPSTHASGSEGRKLLEFPSTSNIYSPLRCAALFGCWLTCRYLHRFRDSIHYNQLGFWNSLVMVRTGAKCKGNCGIYNHLYHLSNSPIFRNLAFSCFVFREANLLTNRFGYGEYEIWRACSVQNCTKLYCIFILTFCVYF